MSREREEFDEIGKKIKGEFGRHMFGPPSAGTLNTITPCAACKLLRRRCAQECPFSPYFSPQEPQKFAAVHKVFGASNVSKLLMEVPESHRADAANSLVYEANVRLRDPVYGCMGAISSLQQQLQSLLLELNAVRADILKHKLIEEANNNNMMVPFNSHHHVIMAPNSLEAVSISVPTLPPLPTTTTSNSSSSSSSSSIFYTQHNAPSNYGTISSDDVSYFG